MDKQSTGTAVYRRLFGYTKGYRKFFLFAIIGMIVYSFAEMQMAAFIEVLVDEAFIAENQETIRSIPLILGLIVLGRSGGTLFANYFMSWVSRGVIKQLRSDMFRQLLHLPTRFYDKASSGQIISQFSFNVEQVAEATTTVITTLIQDSLLVAFLLWFMFATNAKLSLVLFVAVPLTAVLVYGISFRFRKVSRRIQQSVGKVTHVVNETVDSHQVVKVFGGEHNEKSNFEGANERNFQQNMKLSLTKAVSGALIQFLSGVALIGIVYLATSGWVGEVDAGVFSAFIVAMARMAPPLKHLTNINVQLQKGIAAAQSIFEMLDEEPEQDHGRQKIERAKGRLEYRNVTFSYECSKGPVLHNISFTAEPGKTIALVGRSGGGKSTIVKLVPRFYDVDQGEILLDGHNIKEYKLSELRNQIAFVSQHVTLFNDTIANNIAYGRLGDASREEIVAAAKSAYAMDFIEKLPEGLDTLVGEDGILLSGGQRQRLAIARALLKDAPILILDEATSALDSESEQYIQNALENLVKNRTTIVIAHRLSTVENADKIIVLDNGRIEESGTHKKLIGRGGQYASLYNLQFNLGETTKVPEDEVQSQLDADFESDDLPGYGRNFIFDRPGASFWERMWYGSHPAAQLLAPFGYLFHMLASARRWLYRAKILSSQRFNVPVVVVGNITVGGTGKTPLVIWLANYLKRQGYRPGIISRGYKGKSKQWPLAVSADSDPRIVGDEAALIVRRTHCPMVIGPDRREAVNRLLSENDCDIVISDDGLQHYALRRDIEIVVADGARGFGNGMLLPAGPMREPKSRLKSVDYIVTNGATLPDAYPMYVKGEQLVNLVKESKTEKLKTWAGKKVHAVAAIGNPQRFFDLLRYAGLHVVEHPFPDHHEFHMNDLVFEEPLPIVMTEKDAVKCRQFLDRFDADKFWYIPVTAKLPKEFGTRLSRHIETLLNEQKTA
ncbi:MAG TPA: lipid A export permease/ATP-binding protein MsbA [Gammaproteobacteria bacterium]